MNKKCPEQYNMIKLQKYNYFDFSPEYNFMPIRILYGFYGVKTSLNKLIFLDNKLHFDNYNIKSLHIHFNSKSFVTEHIIGQFLHNNMYIELYCCLITSEEDFKNEIELVENIFNDFYLKI